MSAVSSKATSHLSWSIRFLLSIHSKFTSEFLRRSNGKVIRFVENLVDFKSPPTKTPLINGVTTHDITVDPSRNLWFRLYIPNDDEASNSITEISLPLIIYFHGGGFSFFAADSKIYDSFCKRLAVKLPAIIVSVNYRMAPEHPFPSAYDDGFDVVKFLADPRRFDFGRESVPVKADLSRCFLAGDSAGGNLAHHVALKVAENSRFTELKVIGIIAIQPFFGGEERTESEIRLARAPVLNVDLTDWFWKAFLPAGSDRDHPVVNVFGPMSKDISSLKFPATVVFVGGCDPLQDWQRRYYGGLKKSGKEAYLIEYPNTMHFFYAFASIPESSILIDHIRVFLKKQTDIAQL